MAAQTDETCVVVPTYNEAENLPALIHRLKELYPRIGVVVVDDDSPDGTGALADRLAGEYADVWALHRRGVRGLGTAYLAGIREALNRGYGFVMTMDCDFSHDPASIAAMVAEAGPRRLVIGSRYTEGGRVEDWPLRRRLLSASANQFVKTLFRLPARDCTSGFRLYPRGVVEAVKWENIRSTGYAFLVETLYWASGIEGVDVAEVPICFRDRVEGQSKLGAREAVHGARNLLALRLELLRRGIEAPNPVLPRPVSPPQSSGAVISARAEGSGSAGAGS
jgi:glycosyltransferase involved in cell wall biosynthesis